MIQSVQDTYSNNFLLTISKTLRCGIKASYIFTLSQIASTSLHSEPDNQLEEKINMSSAVISASIGLGLAHLYVNYRKNPSYFIKSCVSYPLFTLPFESIKPAICIFQSSLILSSSINQSISLDTGLRFLFLNYYFSKSHTFIGLYLGAGVALIDKIFDRVDKDLNT